MKNKKTDEKSLFKDSFEEFKLGLTSTNAYNRILNLLQEYTRKNFPKRKFSSFTIGEIFSELNKIGYTTFFGISSRKGTIALLEKFFKEYYFEEV